MGLFDREQKQDPYVARLEDEITYLRRQVEKLQDALFSVSAPEGYKQMKLDEQDLKQEKLLKEIPPEERKKMEWEKDFYSRLAEEQERPLFETVEELESVLSRGTRTKLTVPPPVDPNNSVEG